MSFMARETEIIFAATSNYPPDINQRWKQQKMKEPQTAFLTLLALISVAYW